jgi:voltage-gated sodium channel
LQKVIDDGHPMAWLFFMLFIFVASFAILNLFIALVVDSLAAEQKAVLEEGLEELEGEFVEEREEADDARTEIVSLLKQLQQEVADLKAAVSAGSPPRE